MTKVYIAGPMTGYEDHNFPAFFRAAAVLNRNGYDVENPADNDGATLDEAVRNAGKRGDWVEYMRLDLPRLAKSDAVVTLEGWKESLGARLEVSIAEALKMPVYRYGWLYGIDWLYHKPEMSEVRVTDPDTGGQKGTKPARFDLLPAGPLWQVAELYGRGARKYADRNWEQGYSWSLSFAALQRHAWQFWNGEDVDDETELPHLASVVFHALALMEYASTHPEKDDRPKRAASDD